MSVDFPLSSAIDGMFNGFCPQTLYRLKDVSYWLQTDSKMLLHQAVEPKVKIVQQDKGMFMKVKGLDASVQVEQLHDVIESRIRGNFTGWSGKTAYTLTNGQTWQQTKFMLKSAAKYMPQVLIYNSATGPVMHVAGTSVAVKQIR